MDSPFTMLGFDGIELLLPQRDVVGVDNDATFNPAADIPGAVGRLECGAPVFALDAGLGLCAEWPPDYRSRVTLGRNGEIAFALACEQAATITPPKDTLIEPLRECMRAPANPVEALLLIDERLLLISSIDALQRMLRPERAA